MRILLIVILLTIPALAQDTDHDGLSDSLESALLERFRPAFLLSEGECDVAPAEFDAGSAEPRVALRNGTIYAQASPHTAPGGAFVEVHYFHLWSRDCGKSGHPLDVEHVSALLRADSADASASAYTALYWFAGAHEDTLCNKSAAARAADLKASERGVVVWISAGKHASYLTPDSCNTGGCGGDRCSVAGVVGYGRLINLGEANAPALPFVASKRWVLAEKMHSDFSAALLTQLDSPESAGMVSLADAPPGMQRTIAVSSTTAHAIDDARQRTGNALGIATDSTGNALGRAYRSTINFIRRKPKPTPK